MGTEIQDFIKKAKEALAEKEVEKARGLRREAIEMSKKLGFQSYFTERLGGSDSGHQKGDEGGKK